MRTEVLSPEEARVSKFRIVFEKLEAGLNVGDIVTGAMLLETTYYLQRGMIEQVPDDTPISTDETRRAASIAAQPPDVEAVRAHYEAQASTAFAILTAETIPDIEDAESANLTDVRAFRFALDQERATAVLDKEALLSVGETFGIPRSQITGESLIERANEIIAEAEKVKAEGDEIVEGLKYQIEELKKEIERLEESRADNAEPSAEDTRLAASRADKAEPSAEDNKKANLKPRG